MDHAVFSADAVVATHDDNADATTYLCVLGRKNDEIVQSGLTYFHPRRLRLGHRFAS